MDAYGYPVQLFATNRWVTAEAWYRAEDVIAMQAHFKIDHAFPSWPVNQWISPMLVLLRPQIQTLLRQRNRVVADWASKHPDADVFEDRALELTGFMAIDVEQQTRAVVAALEQRS